MRIETSANPMIGLSRDDLAQVNSPDGGARSFDELLNASGASTQTPEQRARAAAEKMVATAFVQPVLKQLREANNAPAPWGPTDAEKQFGPLLDAQIAERIVQAARFPTVDRMARMILGPEDQKPPPEGPIEMKESSDERDEPIPFEPDAAIPFKRPLGPGPIALDPGSPIRLNR